MKQHLKFIGPLSLLLVLLISACEVPRPGGTTGDISTTVPQPVATTAPPATAPIAPTPEEGVLPPDISPEKFPHQVAPDATAIEPGKVLVKLTGPAAVQARSAEAGADGIVAAGISSLDPLLRQIGASSMEPVVKRVAELKGESLESFSAEVLDVSQLYAVRFDPANNPQDVANLLAQDPTVEYAEPNYIAGITGRPVYIPVPLTPNDPYFKYQWHLQAIQAPAAWDRSTGQGVIVAVVDTGVDFGAPDLANTNRLPGYDFVNNDTDPTDDQSHGTHVAGTIAQSTNNGVGVAGVAFNANLLPVKVLGSDGQGSYENIIRGIMYAVDQGARVINLSLAGRNGSQALRDAMAYAYNRGVLVVAAAGNSNGPVEFPAAYDDYVLAVGSTRFDSTRAPYSNSGSQIDLVAPGGDIDVDQNQDGYADGILQQTFKTPGSGYTYLFFEGTSMASPHVAGVAALMLSRKPNASPDEVKTIMMRTARSLGSPDQFGAGLVQAADAVAAIAPTTPGPQPTTPVPPPTTPALPPTTPAPPPTTPAPPPTTPAPPPTTPAPVPTTPAPPPTTPAPLPAGELLVNGGFESGEGWVFGDTPIPAGYDTTIALSGNRSVRLGATSGPDKFSFSSVWQRVTIPAEARQVTLSANIYPVSQDVPGTDIQYIAILNDRFRMIRTLSAELSNRQTWEARSFDLSDLRGQTIYVYFSVLNRGRTGRLTAMYVDDISLSFSK